MQRVLLLLLVAGCGFEIRGGSATGDGGPVDDLDPPIDATDAPIDTMPLPGDQDGDGVPDATDNCVAMPNADQRNHDMDSRGDVCDRCPHLPSINDPDGDGDGVGDDCDPNPAVNTDRRRFFGFYDVSEIANGWTSQGVWTVAGGYLVQGTSNLSGTAPPNDTNVPFVMTEVVIDNPDTNFDLGISDQVTATSYDCALVKQGSNVAIRARIQGGGSTSLAWTGMAGAGARVQLTLDLADDVDCRATQTGGHDVHPIQSSNGDPTGRIYVGTAGVAARFDYLFIVDQEP